MGPTDWDARAAWNAGTDAFADFLESGADYYRLLVHGPALLAACGDVRGRVALDVGCGHGYFSRLLARAGARVTGVDVADEMIAHAAAREAVERLGITYVRTDAARVADEFGADRFDLVAGCMSLQDMAEPAAVLAGCRRVLRGGGRALFSVPHPCTELPVRAWKRDAHGRKVALCLYRYFDTGPAVCRWDMARLKYAWSTPFRRHTLSEWSDLVRRARLVIRGLVEPRPDAALVAARPELEPCSRMPYFLIFELAPSPTPPKAAGAAPGSG